MKSQKEAAVFVSDALSQKLHNMSVTCALLVVLIHCYVPSETWSAFWWFTELMGGGRFQTGGIVRCAVPFFFLSSGFFVAGKMAEANWWRREVAKRVRTLLIPFVVWSALAAMVVAGYTMIIAHTVPTWGFWANAFGLEWQGHPLLKQLWFVKCLFLLVLCSPVLARICTLPAILFVFALEGVRVIEPFDISWKVYSMFGNTFSLQGVSFFMFGIWLRTHKLALPARRFVWPVAVLGGVLMLMAYAVCDGYGSHRMARLLNLGAIPFTMAALWWMMPESRWPLWVTKNAFPLYVLHLFPLIAVRGALFPGWRTPPERNCFLVLAMCWGAAVAFSFVNAYCLRRFFPRLAGIVFGGR